MSNVLSEEKKQQAIALGKLGWPLRRIEQATGVPSRNRQRLPEAAGIVVRLARFWGKRMSAKPAKGVPPDFFAPFSRKPGPSSNPSPPSVSICEKHRELIEKGLAQGRNGRTLRPLSVPTWASYRALGSASLSPQ